MRTDLALFFLFVLVAIAVAAIRLAGVHFEPVTGALLFGAGIVCCAFLMGTAAELAQLDVSENLALVVVALLAVLPEYAVDLYFAYSAGSDPSYATYALANMTGANRLLIGFGWPFLVFVWWLRARKREIVLEPAHGGAVVYLGLATIYCFVIPLKGSLSLLDTVILCTLFGFYLRYASKQGSGEIELVGPAEVIARLPVPRRRLATIGIFVLAGGGIFASSEPFAENLLACGSLIGIDRYYLVQWLAPLASESPEFVVAALLVWKRRPGAGFGTLLSSKLNQWTLLVGAIPVAYGIALLVAGKPLAAMPIDSRQFSELVLTGAQSFFAVCVLLNRNFQASEALSVLVLFAAQLVTSITLEQLQVADLEHWLHVEKMGFSALYGLLGIGYLIGYRRHLPPLARSVWR